MVHPWVIHGKSFDVYTGYIFGISMNLNLPPLSLAAAVTAAVMMVLLVSVSFPSLVTGNNWNLGERWGLGSHQGR
jgi:hypothetical protein